MGDEYGIKITREIEYQYDYDGITNRILKNINEFSIENMTNILDKEHSINLFDLFILKKFIEENQIKSIIEFGAGSSSKLIDHLGIKRTSFSIENNRPCYDIKFENVNILTEYDVIEKYIQNNSFDMVLVDAEHSNQMAVIIHEKFLKLMNYKNPVFFHDWFNNGKIGYKEQLYYINNILDYYNVEYITDLPDPYISKLKQLNTDIDRIYTNSVIAVRCSAILTPKTN